MIIITIYSINFPMIFLGAIFASQHRNDIIISTEVVVTDEEIV